MRRFHADHEGVMPDEHVLSLWKCDEVASAATLSDYSYTGAFPLIKKGAGGITAQIGLFLSGVEGTVEVTSPVASGLTLWAEADDAGQYDDGVGNRIFPDKGTYTFTHATHGPNSTTAVVVNGARGANDALNGKNGFVFLNNANHVRPRPAGHGSGGASLGGFTLSTDVLYDPSTNDFTVQFLGRVPTGAAGSSYWLRTDWGALLTYMSNEFSASDVRYGFTATFHTLHAIDNDVHLYTITKSGNDWSVYLDDNFTTPVATFSASVTTGAAALQFQQTGTKCSFFAALTYNRVLSSAELTTNHTYLSGTSRWGTW